ncbi:MAG: iron ABC transporter permease [Spirochaetaceae bacterium]|jgi:iron complex transport system permease protein|nr:iron ABC transporter permease [Spirochaetaceae bacterium]
MIIRRSAALKLTIAFIASFFLIYLGTSFGSSGISAAQTLNVLLNKFFFVALNDDIPQRTVTIIWELRLPRVLLAFCAGGALAVSGAVVQSILKNQLASPYILGVSSGASLGAGLVMLSGASLPFFGVWTLPAGGFLFALLTVYFVIAFSARLDKTISNNTVILFGMVVSLFVNALLTMLIALYREELRSLIIWQMGSFALRGWPYLKMLLPFLILGFAGVMRWTREMDILTFGDEHALSSGVDTKRVKHYLFLFSALLTGSAVALSGTIGFVDLIAPHLSRKILGSEHRFVLPMSFCTGGFLCVTADIIARTIVAPSELPVGAITALVGAPFFIWIYFKKRHA